MTITYACLPLIRICARPCSAALFGDDRLFIMPEILEQPEYALYGVGIGAVVGVLVQ
jgi:hypothetical protein